MKRVLTVVLCLVLMLPFVGCDDKNGSDSIFIGVIEKINKDDLEVSVANQFASEFGDSVTVKNAPINSLELCVGDEILVRVKSAKGDNVKAKRVELLVCTQKRNDICLFDKQSVPDDMRELDLNRDEFRVIYDGSYYTYRVVEMNENVTYLADYRSTEAECILVGDYTDAFSVGYFVKIKTALNRRYGCYRVLFEEHITEMDVIGYGEIRKVSSFNMAVDKPVIYLYPETQTTVDVDLEFGGEINTTYPDISNNGWHDLSVKPDGTITKNGREYYCLFWEGEGGFAPSFSNGFCIKGEDTAEFLEKSLKEMGLNDKEANEFIIYWLPILSKNEYNLISFQGENYTNAAKLDITPKPQTEIRIFMAYKSLENPVYIEPQEFEKVERVGFTVVEWGGGEVK